MLVPSSASLQHLFSSCFASPTVSPEESGRCSKSRLFVRSHAASCVCPSCRIESRSVIVSDVSLNVATRRNAQSAGKTSTTIQLQDVATLPRDASIAARASASSGCDTRPRDDSYSILAPRNENTENRNPPPACTTDLKVGNTL